MKNLTQETIDQLESRVQNLHRYIVNAIEYLDPDVRAEIIPYKAPGGDIGESLNEFGKMKNALSESRPIIHALLDIVARYENIQTDATSIEAGYQYQGKDVWEIKQDGDYLLNRYRFVIDIEQAAALDLVDVELGRIAGDVRPPINLDLSVDQIKTTIDQRRGTKAITKEIGELIKNQNFYDAKIAVEYAFNKYPKPMLDSNLLN